MLPDLQSEPGRLVRQPEVPQTRVPVFWGHVQGWEEAQHPVQSESGRNPFVNVVVTLFSGSRNVRV